MKIRRRWNLPILFGAFVPLDPRPYVEGDTGHLLAAQAALARVHPRATLRPSSLRSSASYRSAISYLDEEQRRVAYDTIADVEASGLWPGKVVTEVTPAGRSGKPNPSIGTISSGTRTANRIGPGLGTLLQGRLCVVCPTRVVLCGRGASKYKQCRDGSYRRLAFRGCPEEVEAMR